VAIPINGNSVTQQYIADHSNFLKDYNGTTLKLT